MERERRPFEIRLVNLQEMLDSIDVFRRITGIRLQDIYNLMLKKGWTLGSPQLTRSAVRNPAGQSAGDAGFDRRVPQDHRNPAAGHLQPDAQKGLDARLAAADGRHASGYPAVSSPAGEIARTDVEREKAGAGGVAGAQFQSRAGRESAARAARSAASHDSHRSRRLSAALLDRTAGAVLHLRLREGRRTGAGAGSQRVQSVPRFGNDSESELLRSRPADAGRSRARTGAAGARSGAAGGTGFVWRPGIVRDARDRPPVVRASPAGVHLRP